MTLSKTTMNTALHLLAGVALASASFAASAVSTWKFGEAGSLCSQSEVLAGNCAAQSGSDPGAPLLKGTAFSVSTSSSGSTFATAALTDWSGGLGAGGESSSPDHAIDNNGRVELIAFDFGASSIALTGLTAGWWSGDSDFSLLRWTGSTAPNLSTQLAGKTIAGLTSAGGWELVGNYANMSTGNPYAVNSGNLTSSWWLVSAYNSGYTGANTSCNKPGSNYSCTNGNDYFKLLTLAGTVTTPPDPGTGVPEPGSLALMGAALAGLAVIRRRRNATA
ncbi:MAG: PEP-CTERM sorting domain-containing protein [Rhodoferax sp.]|nr:PEP-CTERM sorting domain-containing protein [Rhodoferax sp.]MCW5628435.1 PEP-CTERM sorting domain-containing protein [Rhodoferax sp.]MCW5644076.1 PEP-CTERM sorting domain-containing protein [Rhodoferax sp.]